jgi:hypothetical protein
MPYMTDIQRFALNYNRIYQEDAWGLLPPFLEHINAHEP